MKTEALESAKSSVRSYIVLGRDTMDLFCYMTADAPEPFSSSVSYFHYFVLKRLLQVLGERLAQMLNYNITQLCGPKCTEIKVRDAKKRFLWEPRETIGQIVDVYLNLGSDQFAAHIAADDVSDTYSLFFHTHWFNFVSLTCFPTCDRIHNIRESSNQEINYV